MTDPVSDKDRFVVGKVATAHGIKGEVKVYPLTDYEEDRFAPGSQLLLGDAGDQVQVDTSKPMPPFLLIRFAGITSRTQAEGLKGSFLYVRRKDAPALEDDTYWVVDLVGCRVETLEGEVLGEITDVLLHSSNDVYIVARPEGPDLLVPAIKDVVKQVSIEDKVVKIWPMPGLLD